jgi:hypothetical protein
MPFEAASASGEADAMRRVPTWRVDALRNAQTIRRASSFSIKVSHFGSERPD